jgi:electron transfer flavoprotein alpha subunit
LLSTLAVLEHRGGQVSAGSLPAVTAAVKLGGSVTAFIAGSDSASVAEQASRIDGIEKVHYVPNSDYDKVRLLFSSYIFKGFSTDEFFLGIGDA